MVQNVVLPTISILMFDEYFNWLQRACSCRSSCHH